MKCPKCQAENPDGVKFCGECGETLLTELVCQHCGHKNPKSVKFCYECGHALVQPISLTPQSSTTPPVSTPLPTSFVNGRYKVKKFLGEGGKKKVYLAHDTVLDRDVAFALIKTETLDEAARKRVTREAQTMGKLGDHPNIITIFDIGEEKNQPYIILPLMPGDDVGDLIKKAPEHRLPIPQAIKITREVCKGLEYAHARGIIHRDIKPGNVMLGTDGAAMIGDFGLALSTDLARLTHEGMMVGTYYYMPPEQAMGGEVTPRADLYSLGAMLYEMVTGRPPFIGDDVVTVIGQHINTPPVTPSWHRHDVPSALTALIMQLLEKDPQHRPTSAKDVRESLEGIETGKAEKATSGEAATPEENPLFRRVFVGREPELRQLQSAFDNAVSGQGSLQMVVGEPGIGKTALTEKVATYVSLRGGRAFVGHCYEEGSLTLPYLAFVEVLRSYTISREVAALRKELGTGAADVARIVSEIRERLRIPQPKGKGNQEEEKYRLLQAVTEFLGNAAAIQPLLIVLEDLHDADQGTLEMLSHVARNVNNKRILIIGTYRDIEVDRTHPLSHALAELRRVSAFGRVLLRGLNADEVRRMLETICGHEVPWGLAQAVHRQTEGNPLFVQEVVRYLFEQGLISRESGQWRPTTQTPLEMSIPEGLRDVIGKRLTRLSTECNRILSIAAVIGREFRLDVLQKVADVPHENLLTALQEAKQAAVLEERTAVGIGASFRFAHAFFRQTLYEEMFVPRRIITHQKVGRVLEDIYKQRLQEHAAEMAEHFAQSTDHEDLEKALKYSEMAAERANSVYAYGETVHLLDQALKVQEVLDPEDKAKRCDLLIALCWALVYARQYRRVIDIEAHVVLSLVDQLNDNERAATLIMCVAGSIMSIFGILPTSWAANPEPVWWMARIQRYAQPGTRAQAWVDLGQGILKIGENKRGEGVTLIKRALDTARGIDDDWLYVTAATGFLFNVAAPHHWEERYRLAEDLLGRLPDQIVVNTPMVNASVFAGNVLLEAGDRKRCERYWRENREAYERAGLKDSIGLMTREGNIATLDGRLEEAVEIADRIYARGEAEGLHGTAVTEATGAGLRAWLHLGKAEKPLELIGSMPVESMPAQTALCLAHLSRNHEVTEILVKHVMERPGVGTTADENPGTYDTLYLEAAVLVGHRKAANLLLSRFTGTGMKTTGWAYPTVIIRHMGAAAVLLERYDEAHAHYTEALKLATEMKFRPEIALTRLEIAELILEHYPKEKKEAIEHLDFAIKEFREMKMQPSLERALRHKEILKA